ncbi:GntR family transcriptional regulator [Paenibacillus sp. 1P07SE]|uniref:GntR family transcriptional regulator n=1 Tax=Paenibacillus sp. 1P07SE TaxID=3132209 RepID=UPI0039A6CEA9
MLDETLPVTLQFQLRSRILEKIEQKFWPPGAQITSERELCEEYGVSRMTVREVLRALVQEGVLVRKQGRGTYVSLPKFEHELTSSYSLSREIEREGLRSHFQLLDFKKYAAPVFLRPVFALSADDPVYEITRLRYIGDELFAWERAYTPCKLLEGAGEEELQREGLYPTVYRASGLIAETAEVETEAVNCPPEIAELLGIKKKTAVLHLTRITKAQGQSIEYCESYVRSEKYKYKYKQALRKKAFQDRDGLHLDGM